MIDLHCHILHGVDDGSPDLSESLEIARAAVAGGMKIVTATPHVMDRDGARFSKQEIVERVKKFQAVLDEEGIGLKIVAGAEYYLDRDLPGLINLFPTLSTINGTQYLLVEMPGASVPDYIEYSVFNSDLADSSRRDLLLRLRPIIAHPERNQGVIRNWQKCFKLRDLGYILQVNLGSLLGFHGKHVKKTAETLLGKGIADLVSTDSHSAKQMQEVLTHGPKALKKLVGQKRLEVLTSLNPARVIKGDSVDVWEG